MNLALLLDDEPLTGMADRIKLCKDDVIYAHSNMFTEKADAPGEYLMVATEDSSIEYGEYEILVETDDTDIHTGQMFQVGPDSPKVTLNYYSFKVTDDQNAGATKVRLADSAIPGPKENTVLAGGSVHIYVDNSKLREGTIFDHWEINASKVPDFIANIKEQDLDINCKTTIVAVSRPIHYYIAFDNNQPKAASENIIGKMNTVGTDYGLALELPLNAYQLPGWTFLYWTSEDDGTGTIYPNGDVVENMTEVDGATRTLYAQWRQNKYQIQFDANEPKIAEQKATGTMEPIKDIWYEAALELPINTFKLEGGWRFTGWNTKADGSGIEVADRDTISRFTKEDSATITLYAQWKADVYEFTEGMDSEWKKGSDTGLQFKTNGPIENFRTLLIDGNKVDEDAYKLTSGSTIIDLDSAGLEKMETGKHTITANYVNGSSPSTAFSVKKSDDKPDQPDDPSNSNKSDNSRTSDKKAVKTGDETPIVAVVVLLIISMAMITVLLRYRLRYRYNRK